MVTGERCVPAAEEGNGPHFVFVQTQLDREALAAHPAYEARPEWFAVCARLTTRAERLSDATAMLDLGQCSDAEALDAASGLLAHLTRLAIPARVGIAASGCLAELTLLRAHGPTPIRLLTSADAAPFLHRIPVEVLSRLSCARTLTPATIERLQHYGLRTFAHVARLGEQALRRQFGGHTGAVLAAIVCGRDPRPLSPTPPAAALCIRLRIPAGAGEPERLPTVLSQFAENVARHLLERGKQTRSLRLVAHWESGARHRMAFTLQRHTNEPALLLDALWRLLRPRLTATTSLAALWLTLHDFAPMTPEQETFWRTRAQRLNAIEDVADTMTRRYGHSVLLSARLSTPDAVFHTERYTLHPTTSVTVADTSAAAPPHADAQQPPPFADVQRDVWQDAPHHLHWW